MAVYCEAEIGSRAENGKPMTCGKTARWFRMSGGIASVKAALCNDHLMMFSQRGYKLESIPDPAEEAGQ